MDEILVQTLKKVPGLEPVETLVVGVSGGADSICLLHLLATHTSHRLVVAHLDHQLRPESAQEAENVRQFAGDLGCPFILEQVDTTAFSETHSLSIEEAARELRYQFLFSSARQQHAAAVCVAHHADDQVETVLMHLLRGSGLAGLGGMPISGLTPWDEHIPLVRPLLAVPRSEIEAYCQEHDLQTVQDSSNLDTTYYRNRLRHELIPFLESFNPQVRNLIGQMADTLREDYEVLLGLTNELLADSTLESGKDFLALDSVKFSRLPLGIKRNLIRQAIARLRPGLRDIDYQAVARALRYIQAPPKSGQADLISGLKIQIEADRFIIADWEVDLLPTDWPQWRGEEISLAVPGVTELDAGWRVRAELLAGGFKKIGEITTNPDPFQAYFALQPGVTTFSLRHRQPGDRMNLLGMPDRSVKISDLMINAKLARRARRDWPLVLSSGLVVWVMGVRQSADLAVTEKTETILRLRVERNG